MCNNKKNNPFLNVKIIGAKVKIVLVGTYLNFPSIVQQQQGVDFILLKRGFSN